MLRVLYQGQFKKDYKLALKRGLDPKKLTDIIALLANEQPLPEKCKDHALTDSRRYVNVRECHISPDWLLIYRVVRSDLVLELLRTGTHSDLF